MKSLLKTKSVWVGVVAILCGTALILFGSDDKDIGIAMITSGLGVITLRDAIRKGK